MSDDQFDDMMREKLGRFASDVSDDMWERINRNAKRKKPLLIFWISVSATLILLSAIGYNYFFIHSNTVESKTNSENFVRVQKTPGKIHNFKNKKFSGDSSLQSIEVGQIDIFKRPIARSKANHQRHFKDGTNHVVSDVKSSEIAKRKEKGISKIDNNIISDTASKNSTKKVFNKKDTTLTDPNQNIETPEVENENKFYIEIYGAPLYSVNRISSSNPAHEQLLKNSISSKLSSAIGIRIRLAITKRMSAKIGVTYNMINENINFKNNANGLEYNAVNKYKFLNVPLLMSYTSNSSKSFSFSASTGIVINVSSKYKGAIPSISSQPMNIENENVYYINTGIGLYFGADLSKNINKKIDLFAEPFFQFNVKNMTNSFQPFNQYMHLTGINLGLRFNFLPVHGK